MIVEITHTRYHYFLIAFAFWAIVFFILRKNYIKRYASEHPFKFFNFEPFVFSLLFFLLGFLFFMSACHFI